MSGMTKKDPAMSHKHFFWIEWCYFRLAPIQDGDPKNPNPKRNMNWIGRHVAEIWPFDIPNEMSVVGGGHF